MLVFILMGAVSASENVTDTSTNGDVVTGDVLASPDNSQVSSVANSNVGNVTNVTKNNNSNLLSSPNNGGGSVLGAPDDSFTALQSLINGAASGSTLTLDKNYKFYADYDSAYVNGILIKNQLIIDGNGFTIDGSNSARIFKLVNAVTVNNLTFANALFNGSGGAVFGSKVMIEGGEFDSKADLAKWTTSGSIAEYTCEGDEGAVTANIEIPKNQIGSISQNVQFEDISTLSIRLRVAQYLGTRDSYRVTVYVYAGNTLLKSYTGAFMRNFVTFSADCSKIKGEQTLKISFKPINSDNNYNNHGIIYLDYIRPGNQFTSSITANNCNFINCLVFCIFDYLAPKILFNM